jgi:hypothetical protein
LEAKKALYHNTLFTLNLRCFHQEVGGGKGAGAASGLLSGDKGAGAASGLLSGGIVSGVAGVVSSTPPSP